MLAKRIAAKKPTKSFEESLRETAEVRSQALTNSLAHSGAVKYFPANFQQSESMGWIPQGWDNRTIGDCFQLLGGHSSESQMLTKLRGTLLPKLISGDLRIHEAENLTQEALA